MEFINVLLDAAVLLILVIFAVRGVKRGFVMSVASLATLVLAFLGAGAAARLFSPAVAKMIIPRLSDIALPEFIDLDAIANLTIAGVRVGELKQFTDVQTVLEGTAETVRAQAVSAVAEAIAYAVVAVLAFIVLVIIFKLIFRALNLVAKLPVLRFLNGFLGLLMGILIGAALITAAAGVISIFDGAVPEDTVQATYIYKYFVGLIPRLV